LKLAQPGNFSPKTFHAARSLTKIGMVSAFREIDGRNSDLSTQASFWRVIETAEEPRPDVENRTGILREPLSTVTGIFR
jgi:hypothetical protein